MNLTPAIPHEIMKYGAPMGRWRWNDNAAPFTGRMYLRHIPLNSGGYDSGGAYWGTRRSGERLYGYAADDDSANGFIDAADRAEAKELVLAKYPGARFFN